MTEYCFICGGDHSFKECATMQPPSPPTPPGVNPLPEERPRSSLAPTQFEGIFGEGAEELLQDVLDRPDVFDEDQQDLAESILSGETSIAVLNDGDRTRLDEIGRHLAFMEPSAPPKQAVIPRPAYVRSQAEMENFEDDTPWPLLPNKP